MNVLTHTTHDGYAVALYLGTGPHIVERNSTPERSRFLERCRELLAAGSIGWPSAHPCTACGLTHDHCHCPGGPAS